MVDLRKQFANRVKRMRQTAKLTQEKLAEKTGLSVEYISRIERGVAQPSFKTLVIIAESLDALLKDFFDFKSPLALEGKQQESLQKKDYIEAILSELKDMEVHELPVVYNIIKVLAGK